ncbi:unnamed protein product, partial [Brassica rapa subsp. narinosa]
MIGADRRSRMGVSNEDDDEEPLVIVADTDPNQPMVYYGREGDNYASRDCLLEKVRKQI